ncbi:MAG: FtsX-like permease family protein [Succinivibrio sp.]
MFSNPLLIFKIALRYTVKSSSHKFASFVALLSTLGITVGVAALIVDSAIMQGLQNHMKASVLDDTPHVVVDSTDTDRLLGIDHVTAACPFVQGQALMQSPKDMALIDLQGIDRNALKLKDGISEDTLKLKYVPQKGSFTLNAMAGLYIKNDLKLNSKVRLISTINPRYTAVGLTPTQRIFTLKHYYPSLNSVTIDSAIGSLDDVKRFFRLKDSEVKTRLFLDDPFNLGEVQDSLLKMGYKFTDWSSVQGELFKAIAMEKMTMAIMLCLVVLVAAFNILSALSMMVSARLSDIAVFKSLGLTNSKLMAVFITMGMLCGLTGTLIGCIIGIALSSALSQKITASYLPLLPVSIDAFNIALIVSGSLLMSFVFTLYPSYRAAKTDPVVHLSRS